MISLYFTNQPGISSWKIRENDEYFYPDKYTGKFEFSTYPYTESFIQILDYR